MPNVPNVPGVPALSSFSTSPLTLLVSDAATVLGQVLQPRWGIYLNGTPIIASSLASLLGLGSLAGAVNSISSLFGGANISDQFSVVDFEYKQDWTLATYPVEDGGFQSYDKVQLPFDVKMRVAAGGSASNRQALLNVVDSVANSMNLFDVVTPEKVYQSCNIDHYDYRRSATNGVGMIVVDIWLKEIRVTSTSVFTNTQSPVNSGQQNIGNVQPQTPTAPQTTFATSGSFF